MGFKESVTAHRFSFLRIENVKRLKLFTETINLK